MLQMRRTLLLYLILALLAIGAADHLNLATNDNHETNNHDSVKIERYLSERTSLEHLEEVIIEYKIAFITKIIN
jgi:hypothetical protein